MKSQLIKFVILLFGFISSTCTDSSNEIPPNKPELVVNFIGGSWNSSDVFRGDSLWWGRVSHTIGILTNYKSSEESEVEATSTINENDLVSESLTRDNRLKNSHRATLIYPKPGKKYSIKVETPEGKILSSSYLHPLPVEPLNLTVIPVGTDELNKNVELQLTFLDTPGKDYYSVGVAEFMDGPMGGYSRYYLTIADNGYNNEEWHEPLFDDSQFNGELVTIRFKGARLKYPLNDKPKYYVTIRTLSKEYYEYVTSLRLLINNRQDPFAEPTPIKQNIQNGLGIFGGFTQRSRFFE